MPKRKWYPKKKPSRKQSEALLIAFAPNKEAINKVRYIFGTKSEDK